MIGRISQTHYSHDFEFIKQNIKRNEADDTLSTVSDVEDTSSLRHELSNERKLLHRDIIKSLEELQLNATLTNNLQEITRSYMKLDEQLKAKRKKVKVDTQTNVQEMDLSSSVKDIKGHLVPTPSLLRTINDETNQCELKLLSEDYLEVVEKLDTESVQTDQAITELDFTVKKLLEEKKRNASLTTTLEKLSNAFLDLDDELKREKMKVTKLTALVTD